MAQVATPVVGSTSRKLGQPLVPQKMRELLLATDARRRMRRMELERPARVVVVERDIMVRILVLLSGAPQVVWSWAAAGGCSALDSPRWGPERSGDPRCVPGASVIRGARPEPPLRIGDL